MHSRVFRITGIDEAGDKTNEDEIFDELNGIADYCEEMKVNESDLHWAFDPYKADIAADKENYVVCISRSAIEKYWKEKLEYTKKQIDDILKSNDFNGFLLYNIRDYLEDRFGFYVSRPGWSVVTLDSFLADQLSSTSSMEYIKNTEPDNIVFCVNQMFDYHF